MKNTVILNKDASTWPLIKKYWEDRGVTIPTEYGGYFTKSGGHEECYYGLLENVVGAWTLDEAKSGNAEIIELPEEKSFGVIKFESVCAMCGGTGIIGIDETSGFPQSCPCGAISKAEKSQKESTEIPKEEKKCPVYPKPILRVAYEIIGRLKADNLKRAGFNDIEISTYLEADKDLKEIEKHLNK